MAKIKTSAIVDSISGKLNGSVFSRNRSGAYIRGKGSIRFKPGSELADSVNKLKVMGGPQSSVIATFVSVTKRWKTIGVEMMSAWNAITKDWASNDVFGDSKEPSGFNLFVKMNTISRTLASLAITPTESDLIIAPPAKMNGQYIEWLKSLSSNSDDPEEMYAWEITAPAQGATSSLSNDTAILVEVTRPLSAGVTKANDSDYRALLVDNSTSPVEDEFTISLGAKYQEMFGHPAYSLGKRIHYRVSIVSITDGQKGQPNYFSHIILPDGTPDEE